MYDGPPSISVLNSSNMRSFCYYYFMSSFWTAQLIGAVAVIISVLVFQNNKRSSILVLNSLADVLYAIQFILLNAYTGAAMNIVAASRNYTFYKTKPTRKNMWVLGAFMVAALVATVATWHGCTSLLPLCANWLNATATWQTNTRRLRRIAVLAPPFWILYSIIVHSYPGIVIETIIFCSILLGQYRFDIGLAMAKSEPSESRLQ